MTVMAHDDMMQLTESGYRRLEADLERLRTVDRRAVADRIRDSKQFGEFTENSEYEDAKLEQAFVEGKIIELQKILQNSTVIRDEDVPTEFVGLGSTVRVRDEEYGDEWDYTIVGPAESEPEEDRVSNESPIGRALIGKRAGEQAFVHTPEGTTVYKVLEIRK